MLVRVKYTEAYFTLDVKDISKLDLSVGIKLHDKEPVTFPKSDIEVISPENPEDVSYLENLAREIASHRAALFLCEYESYFDSPIFFFEDDEPFLARPYNDIQDHANTDAYTAMKLNRGMFCSVALQMALEENISVFQIVREDNKHHLMKGEPACRIGTFDTQAAAVRAFFELANE